MCFRVVQLCFWLVMKRGGEGLGKVSPDRAAKPSQAQRREGAGQQRHQPPSYESSPAAAAASRPSFSPQGSTADARSATEAAVRESPICAFFRTVAPLCMLRAPPAPTQRACCQHRKCRVLRGIYIPSSPIWPAAQEAAATLSTGTSDPAREPTTCWHRCSWPGTSTATTAR